MYGKHISHIAGRFFMAERDGNLIVNPAEVARILAITQGLVQQGFTLPETGKLFALSEKTNARKRAEYAEQLMHLRHVGRDVQRGIYNEGFLSKGGEKIMKVEQPNVGVVTTTDVPDFSIQLAKDNQSDALRIIYSLWNSGRRENLAGLAMQLLLVEHQASLEGSYRASQQQEREAEVNNVRRLANS